MNKKIKYLLFPDYIISSDGDRHYIIAPQLAMLYGVKMEECKVYSIGARRGELTELRPSPSGNYDILRNQKSLINKEK